MRARVELVTRAFSQLSTTANRPAKHTPCTSRMENQLVGWMNSTMQIEAAEAIAASAEKVRIWPTARMMRVT
ncbi:hypothetical protein D3C72_2463420 [compost metagenome]